MMTPTVNHPRLKILWMLLLCVQISACDRGQGQNTEISQQELVAQIEDHTAPLILDVRTTKEYAGEHIPGAVNIPVKEIATRIDEIQVPRDAPIVVYCDHGVRANKAEKMLRAAGFKSVLQLQDDLAGWRKNNLPLEPGKS